MMEQNPLPIIESEKSVEHSKPRAIAIVSGKGGSGKTMVAAVMARVLDNAGLPALIVDSDIATGGMTYYLGLKLVPNIAVGLADVTVKESDVIPSRAIQSLKGYKNAKFFGIGDHRLFRKVSEDAIPGVLENVINQLRHDGRWIVVDCRGGIDRESIAVCKAVDDILLVVESDTTSYQATQHLVDTLTEYGLADKLRGFVINKVFEDPSTIVRTGTSVFRCQYLSSIPFDLQAMRNFLVGDVPKVYSFFGIQIWEALYKAYPDSVMPPERRPLTLKEFREVSLTNLDSLRGGLVVAGLIFMLGMVLIVKLYPFYYMNSISDFIIPLLILLGLIGSLEGTRQIVGRMVYMYVRFWGSLSKEAEE